MIISITLSLSCFISTVMLVWFKSDAFVEWASLLGFSSQVKEWEYKNQRFEDVTLNYPRFLKMQSEKFIFRLIGCPLCLCVWLSALTSLLPALLLWFILTSTLGFFIGTIISLICFMVYSSVICVSSLFIFYIISKLINENT